MDSSFILVAENEVQLMLHSLIKYQWIWMKWEFLLYIKYG